MPRAGCRVPGFWFWISSSGFGDFPAGGLRASGVAA